MIQRTMWEVSRITPGYWEVKTLDSVAMSGALSSLIQMQGALGFCVAA